MKKDKPFKFPKSVLNQIEECSNGGYSLFVFDSNGAPIIYSNTESLPHSYALQYFMENYVKGIEAKNIEMALKSIEDDTEDENI